MEKYDVKSCNPLEKPYYTITEAALRWCNLIEHESEILNATGNALLPPERAFPQWPCLRKNAEKILDAILNNELNLDIEQRLKLPHGLFYGGDWRILQMEEIVPSDRLTIRHTDLKAWMAKHYPGQKPEFLFDESERQPHPAINADGLLRALQAERDALRASLERAELQAKSKQEEMKAMQAELEFLRAKINKQTEMNPRAETTYLNIIGGLVELMLGTSPGGQKLSVYKSQAAIISALLEHYNGKPGIARSTLEQKFTDAKRSINAT